MSSSDNREHSSPASSATKRPTPSVAAPAALLWGWPQLPPATNLPRRTLEREIAAGRFPKPIKRVGKRPFWRPADVIAWAEGGGDQ